MFFILSAYFGWRSYTYGANAVAYPQVAKSTYTLEIKSNTPALLESAYKFQFCSTLFLIFGLVIQIIVDIYNIEGRQKG